MAWRPIIRALGKEPVIKPLPVLDTTPKEAVICKTFGCRRHLSLPEQLAGTLCTHCMNIKPININLIIKMR